MAGLRADCKGRRGAVLITAVAIFLIMSLAIGSLLAYASTATRQTTLAVGRDVCRLAAQSAIEIAKAEVNAAFQQTISAQARVVGANIGSTSTSAFDWFEAYSGTTPKMAIGVGGVVDLSGPMQFGDCTVRVGIGRVEHAVGEQFAVVTFVAEAVRSKPGVPATRSTIAETVRFAVDGDLVFGHRLQKARLRSRRCAVYLVRKDRVREYGAGAEFEIALFHIIKIDAGNVARHNVGRELDALETAARRPCERAEQHRFTGAGHVFEQNMTAAQMTYGDERDLFFLADDGFGAGGDDPVAI